MTRSLLNGLTTAQARIFMAAIVLMGSAQAVLAQEEAAEQKSQSLLVWLWNGLGPLYAIAFLFISFALVALAFKYFLALRRSTNIPEELQTQFEDLVTHRQFSEAYELVKEDDTYLGRVLASGMAKVTSGYDKSVAAMQETSDDISMGYEQGLSYVGLIASTATMVGLLGTVHGMIMSFQVIATATAAPKPNELAGGISTAMLTTMVGLLASIPALCIFLFLKNRMDRIVFEVSSISEDLIGKLLAAASKK